MPDRSSPPPVYPIRKLHLPPIQSDQLQNGLPVAVIEQQGDHEVIKLDWVFRAGRPFERQPMTARLTQLMLREGSRNHTVADIAEHLDFYGSSLSLPFHLDVAQISVYTLRKHFPKVLSLLADLVLFPLFSEEEFQRLVERSVAQWQVDLGRNDVVAYRQITEALFGARHPYGYNSHEKIYRERSTTDLRRHHDRFFHASHAHLYMGGPVGDAEWQLLEQFIGQVMPAGQPIQPQIPPPQPGEQRLWVTGAGTKQSAVRLGRRLFSRHHPDYPGLYVLNTILGGYFGSRLMTNIREDKGYTYNIYSTLDSMRYDGTWLISFEVSPQHVEAGLQEVYREMDTLCQHPVTEDELHMVRNYLLGTFLTMLDGPFHALDLKIGLETDGLPDRFFQDLIETTLHIQPTTLLQLAQKYLKREDWTLLIVSGSAES